MPTEDSLAANLSTEAALLYDAVLLFAQALNNLSQNQSIETAALTCDGEDTWQQGVLQKLKLKWWFDGGICAMGSNSREVSTLGQDNVGGMFVFLLVGLLLSIIVAIMEFCWQWYSNRKSKQVFRA